MRLQLLMLAGLVAAAAGESQRFCYKRVGYTRKVAQRQREGAACEGASCERHTVYKTEAVFRTERHCCAGYERDSAARSPDACRPVCSRGCPQGEACTAPNRCECVEGRQKDSTGRCVAVSAPLPGGEPGTLQVLILSYVRMLLDGVKWIGEFSDSATAALEGNLTARAAPDSRSGEFSRRCDVTGVQRWNASSSSSRRCQTRPLVLALPLAAATAHLQ